MRRVSASRSTHVITSPQLLTLETRVKHAHTTHLTHPFCNADSHTVLARSFPPICTCVYIQCVHVARIRNKNREFTNLVTDNFVPWRDKGDQLATQVRFLSCAISVQFTRTLSLSHSPSHFCATVDGRIIAPQNLRNPYENTVFLDQRCRKR